ncbi:virulence factor SrfB, partial [Acinetobacter baumannii]|nr:virulence factor SrfB [Acinetobacter baumannii]
AGHTHRVTLALDSQLSDATPSALAPSENDVLNGTRFALAWRDDEVADFLDQTWIDGWLREVFLHHVSQVENRPEQA